MPRYEVRQEDIQEAMSSSVYIPEQYYTEFVELTYKEIMDDENIKNTILEEAYSRLARAWMKFVNDDAEDKYMTKLKELVENEKIKIRVSERTKEKPGNVAKDVLRACMQSITEIAKPIDEEYYRTAIRYYEGVGTPFTFRPECYEKKPIEVDYDDEFKNNNKFWLGEIVEVLCEKKKSVTDQSLMPFVSSTILNKAKEYFLKFEDEAKTVAKDAIEKIKDKARRR